VKRSGSSLSASLLTVLLSASVVFAQTHGLNPAAIDRSAHPCDDFYQFANGGWLSANPIPAAFSSWGVDSVLFEQNRDVMRDVLEAAAKNAGAPKGSNEQKVGDFYASCMAEDQINAAGLKPLAPELRRIDQIKDARRASRRPPSSKP
jgi:putative endopeptidase